MFFVLDSFWKFLHVLSYCFKASWNSDGSLCRWFHFFPVEDFCIGCKYVFATIEAIFLLLMQIWRPHLYVMLENPLSSWLVKQQVFLKASKLWGMQRYVTYLGAWGHDLLKPTVLFSTLPTLSKIARRATKELRKKHRELIAKRNARKRARGQPVKEYYHRDKNGKFHGGKDLASSAVYPHSFIKAVFQCWQENRLANASGQWPAVDWLLAARAAETGWS